MNKVDVNVTIVRLVSVRWLLVYNTVTFFS